MKKINSLYLGNIKEIELMKTQQLNCNSFSVYDYNGMTLQELICQLHSKLNETIENSNTMIDLVTWLVNEGLEEEVVIKLLQWLDDGTLEKIINENIFNDLNTEIKEVNKNLLNEITLIQQQIESLNNGFINVKIEGCSGNGENNIDDSIIFNKCFEKAKKENKSVFIPCGTYNLKNTVNIPSEISVFGGGKNSTILICDHDGIVFNFLNGENQYKNQGGDLVITNLTIKRNEKPLTRIDGNYAIKLGATYGVTTIENIEIKNMGHHAIYQNDSTFSGTGPIHIKSSRAVTNIFGYGCYFNGTFANIYLDGFHSWGNGGGYAFVGTKSSSVPTQIISISNCDNEYIGGYKQGDSPLPSGVFTEYGLYVENVRSLSVTNGTTFQTSPSSPSDEFYVVNKHCVVLKNVHNAYFESATDIAQRFKGADGIYISNDCTNININGVTVFGSNVGRYNINVQDGAKNVSINLPNLMGFNPNYCNLNGKTNPIFINNGNKLGFLRDNYTGSFILLNSELS